MNRRKGERRALPKLSFTRPKPNLWADGVLVELEVALLDKAWSKDPLYVPTGGEPYPDMQAKYRGVRRWIKDHSAAPIWASTVQLDGERVSVPDGRHRLAVLRDMGYSRVTVWVEKFECEEFLRRFR